MLNRTYTLNRNLRVCLLGVLGRGHVKIRKQFIQIGKFL